MRWWLLLICALIALALGLAVLALVAGVMLEPTGSSFASTVSSIWTTFGPHFAVAALVATILAVAAWLWGPKILGAIASIVAGLALILSAFVVGSIVSATSAAGGSIDLAASLSLGKMGEPPPDALETITTVDGTELKVAIYRPAGDTPAPVFAYIHGGGFMIGTATETAADLRWFADRGWAVFSIDYRLFTPGNPTWDKAPADVACGLAWIETNATRFGGDPTRLALLGDSAGGNLAINLAYQAAQAPVATPCGEATAPDAVVVQYPAVDVMATYERGFPVPGFEPQMLMAGYVGGTPGEFPDRIAAISSASYLTNLAPPTLIIEPEKDSLVVSDGVYAFAAQAREAGVDLELVRIPFANHIYNQIAANSLGNQARRTITVRYLSEQGLAP